MRRNKGFTLVEVAIVVASLSMILFLVWGMLHSSTKNALLVSEQVDVQNNVTLLMNIAQQDIQEAKIFAVSDTEFGIVYEDGREFVLSKVTYVFDYKNKIVTRVSESSEEKYYNIVDFSMTPVKGENYGAKVEIVGGKMPLSASETEDRTRFALSSTFYTRNNV